MEDSRKRSRDSMSASSSDLKRHKSELVEEQETTNQPVDAKVAEFQKKHVILRLKEKEKIIGSMEKELDAAKTINRETNQSVAIVNRLWTQLNNDLQLLHKRFEPMKTLPDTPATSSASSPLLRALSKSQRRFEPETKSEAGSISNDSDERYKATEDAAQAMCGQSKQIVLTILQCMETQMSFHKSCRALIDKGKPDDALKKLNDSLAKSQEDSQRAYQELELKYKEQADIIAKHEEKMATLQQDLSMMTYETDGLRHSLQMAERKLERQQYDFAASAASNATSSSNATGSESKTNHTPSTATASEDALEWKVKAEYRQRELENMRSEKLSTEAKLHALTLQIHPSASSQDSVQNSRWYLAIDRELQATKAIVNTQQSKIDSLQQQLSTANNDRLKEQQSLMAARKDEQLKQAEREALNAKQIQTLRDQLTSLLAEKEDLQRKIIVKESQDGVVTELNAWLVKQKKETDSLKEELKLRSTPTSNPSDKEALERHMMFKRWKASEKAAHEREQELTVQLNAFQSASKDVKDLVKQVKDLERNLADCKQKLELASRKPVTENKDLLEVKVEYEQKKDEYQAMSELMSDELDNTAKSLAEAQEENIRLLSQLTARDQTLQKITAEKAQAVSQVNSALADKEGLSQRWLFGNEKLKTHTALVNSLESKVKQLEEEIHQSKTKCIELEMQIQKTTQKTLKEGLEVEEARDTVQVTNKRLQEIVRRADMQSTQLEQQKKDIQNLKETVEFLERKQQADSSKKKTAKEADKGAATELKYLKSKVQCKVCSDREKSCVLLRCGHCFCRDCIDAIVKQRHRKCPGCSSTFAENDIKPIYLT